MLAPSQKAASGNGDSLSHAYQAVGDSSTSSSATTGTMPSKLDPEEPVETAEVRHQRWLLGISYMLAMGWVPLLLFTRVQKVTVHMHMLKVNVSLTLGSVTSAVSAASCWSRSAQT